MISAPSGSVTSETQLPRRLGAVAHDQLDDLEPLLREVEQVDEAVARHLVLDQAQDQVGRGDRGLDPQQLEVVEVPRVVAAGDDPLAEVLLLGDLADQQVVLVVAGHRDHEVGALDPRALEHPQLRGVAVLDGVLELLLHGEVAAPVLLDHGDLVAALEQLAGEVPADLARAGDDHVEGRSAARGPAACSSCSIAIWVGQIVCRPCSAYQAARRGSSTRAITFWTPKRRWASCATTRFGVVAVRGGDEHVGLVDPRLGQRVHLERGADREPAAGLLPRGAELDVQALVGERVLVQDGDGVAGPQGRGGDGRADAAGSDDEDEHRGGTLAGVGRGRIRREGMADRVLLRQLRAAPGRWDRAPRARRTGGAVRITRQCAFWST